MRRYLLTATVGFTSFSTLVLEVTSTRILSYIFWNHIVYLTVSLALLGFGVSGTLVVLLRSRFDLASPRALARLLAGFGLSSAGALMITAWVLPRVTWHPAVVGLLLCYVVYVVPFIFSGAILSSILSSAVTRVGGLYSTDLIAAGLGCLAFFFLLPLLGAPILVLALAAVALALGLAWSERRDLTARAGSAAGATGLIALAVAQASAPALLDFRPIPQKEMGSFADRSQYPHSRVERTTWTPLARIDVVGDNSEPLWGYPHPPGSYKVLTQDGTAHTRLPSRALIKRIGDEVRSGAAPEGDVGMTSLPYRIRQNADVAVIGAGGGMDVANALAFGARSVYAVELNPATYNYARGEYAGYSGDVMRDPRVTLVSGEGRSTLRALGRRFDALQVIAIDTFAALSSGAYVLSENHLYTVEAFQDMLSRLRPGGVLSFYRWLFTPPRETLRLSAVACEAWRREGMRDCERRVMVVGGDGWAMSMFKNGAFTAQEVATLAAQAHQLGRHVLFWPAVLSAAEQRRMAAADQAGAVPGMAETREAFTRLLAAYRDGRQEDFFRSYRYNVAPTTDDSPFFFEYNHLNALGLPPAQSGGLTGFFRGNVTGLTLYMILAEATVLCLLAIFWPLWRYQRTGLRVPHAGAHAVYFAALGFGFMMTEIGLTQKLVLFLGNPLYSLPVVLATLLVSAGAGSRLAAARGWDMRRVTGPVALAFLGLLVVLTVSVTPLSHRLLQLPLIERIGLSMLSLAPLGTLMGTFFPTGLRALGEECGDFVPWAWGINGCTSVYGSVLAILIAMLHGFSATLAAGAVIYAVGFSAGRWVSVTRRSREPGTAAAEAELAA